MSIEISGPGPNLTLPEPADLRDTPPVEVAEEITPELEEAIGIGIVGGGIVVFSQLLGMLQQNLNRLPPET